MIRNSNDHGLTIKYDIKSISIHVMRTLRWKEGYQSIAFITLLVWTFTCFHTQFVIYSLPVWATLAYIYYPLLQNLFITIDNPSTVLKEEMSYFTLLPSFDYLKDTCQQQWHMQSWTLYGKSMSFVCFLGTWMLTFYMLGTRPLVWLVGALVLSWHSHGFQVIRFAVHRAILLLIHAKRKLKSISTTTHEQQQQQLDRCYRFNVIEHQRWWFHKGWISVLLPHDRPKWSDEYLKKVPSIHEFQLPPITTKFDPITHQRTEITWEWASDEWQKQQEQGYDQDGWEYGSWDWTNWSSVSTGPTKLTRRRHWFRHARLIIATTTTHPIPIPPRANSIMTSCSLSTSTTLSSLEDDDNSSSFFLCTTPTSLLSNSNKKPTTKATLENHFWLTR